MFYEEKFSPLSPGDELDEEETNENETVGEEEEENGDEFDEG